ncbi:alpha/beta hydrolase-fold protein [Tenacibaculum larymnensis]|uniref:Esterase family protein n=1 Tax=Tenacibaculum larymnensis TaxID=2878201 RepID=A0A9X4EQ67_9FLAO|nr:alpha/beta hydrolase-fold protein [Tenacibaculum larymnensis]MDE1208191.1 esterase family protein [Tenacibaculum larymnensis]
MKQVYLLFTLLISTSLFSQKVVTQNVNSKELGKDRNIKVYLPKGYDVDETTNYPLAIVLGDEYLFDLYVGNAKLYANVDKAPRQIVVGIDMKNTYGKDISIIPSNNSLTSTGVHFFNFIKHELIPFMEGNFRTSPFMTIVGEGKAANFITHYLKDERPVFNSYICITPDFPQFAPAIMESYSLNRLGSIDNTYFLYTSNNKKYIDTKQYNRFSDIKTLLTSYEAKNFNVTFDEFDSSPSYLAMIGETIPRAFTQMFSLYSKITKEEYEANVKDLAPLDAIKYVEKKYLDIQYLYGSNLNVRLDDIFVIEDIVIDRQDGDYLRVLGDFVMIKYPDSHMGDFYIGKYYELGKDYEKADFYYKAAYGKMDPSDPNANAFYENIKRVNDLMGSKKKEEIKNNDEEIIEEQEEEGQE